MRVAVQAESIKQCEEAAASNCEKVRFGPEFCDMKLPDPKTLRLAYKMADDGGKEFAYVTPPASNPTLEKIKRSLSLLDELGSVEVIVNDLGVLRILRECRNLEPHLGRLRVYTPGRCPWPQITRMSNVSYYSLRRVGQIFYQTALNYDPTIEFYREMGVNAADVDWIPQSFKHYKELISKGIRLSIHTFLVPVTATRRCHSARFLDEPDPTRCSHPCLGRAFRIKQETVGVELFLEGNVVYRYSEPQPHELKDLEDLGEIEVVLSASCLSDAVIRRGLAETVTRLKEGV